jgi:hypothetical protein
MSELGPRAAFRDARQQHSATPRGQILRAAPDFRSWSTGGRAQRPPNRQQLTPRRHWATEPLVFARLPAW